MEKKEIESLMNDIVMDSSELKDDFVKVWGFESTVAEISRTAIEVGIRWQKKQHALQLEKLEKEIRSNMYNDGYDLHQRLYDDGLKTALKIIDKYFDTI